jgi:hypothetical protein
MTEETLMEKAERRGPQYVAAVKHGIAWREYYASLPNPPKEGDIIQAIDPDSRQKKVEDCVVTRIAGNGLRVAIVRNNEEENKMNKDRQKMIHSGSHFCPGCGIRMSDKIATCPKCDYYDSEELI